MWRGFPLSRHLGAGGVPLKSSNRKGKLCNAAHGTKELLKFIENWTLRGGEEMSWQDSMGPRDEFELAGLNRPVQLADTFMTSPKQKRTEISDDCVLAHFRASNV